MYPSVPNISPFSILTRDLLVIVDNIWMIFGDLCIPDLHSQRLQSDKLLSPMTNESLLESDHREMSHAQGHNCKFLDLPSQYLNSWFDLISTVTLYPPKDQEDLAQILNLTRDKNFIFRMFPYQFLTMNKISQKYKNFEFHFHCSKQFFFVKNCLQLLLIYLHIQNNLFMASIFLGVFEKSR